MFIDAVANVNNMAEICPSVDLTEHWHSFLTQNPDARAVIDGLSQGQASSGADLGEAEHVIEDLSPRPALAEVEASPMG